MIMDDHEILMMYKQAADPKGQIEILADLNACSVWEMREKLIALGASVDGRWYQNLNPKRKKKTDKPEGAEACAPAQNTEESPAESNETSAEAPAPEDQKIVVETAELIAEMKRKDAELADLRQASKEKTERIDELERILEDLNQKMIEMAVERERLMGEAKGEIERLTERLRDCEAYVRELEDARDADRRTDAAADWEDVLNTFICSLTGVEAYAAGLILEALYFRPEEPETWSAIRKTCGMIEERARRGKGGDGDAA